MEFAKSLGITTYKANSTGIDTYHEITYCFSKKQCLKMQSPHSQSICYRAAYTSPTYETGKVQEILQTTVSCSEENLSLTKAKATVSMFLKR